MNNQKDLKDKWGLGMMINRYLVGGVIAATVLGGSTVGLVVSLVCIATVLIFKWA